MRKIKFTEGLGIAFGFAGAEGEALTTVQINIPIDGQKYIQGVNIIECIKERLLPLLNVGAINQQLSSNDISLLNALLTTGTIQSNVPMASTGAVAYHLLAVDNSALGIVSFIEGENKPTYTP
jgi:hypothetical protein